MDRRCTSVVMVCSAVVWVTGGCGSSVMSVGPIQPEFELSLNAAATGTKVAVGEFEDAREFAMPNDIGEAKTGFFNESTRIVCPEPVSRVVAGAVERGFSQVGFDVVDRQESDYTVSGQIHKFEASEYATGVSLEYAKGYVQYDLLIRDRTGTAVWGATLDEYEVSGNTLDATEQNLAVLTRALQLSVESIFANESFWEAMSE